MVCTALDILYALAAVAALPWLLYRRVVLRKPVAGLRVKLTGAVSRRQPERPCVWFHAVSVGEVLQLQTLVAEFHGRCPCHEVVISTTTGTGYDVARQKFPQHTVTYWPLDFSGAVNRALEQLRPELVVLVELELWPNFLLAARRRRVPVVVINGRISARSYRGYRRWRSWLRPLFASLTHVAAQTPEYAERFRELGVAADRVTVTGNIKYDRVEGNRRNPQTQELRACFGLATDDLVFIAGSTQDPEERLALEAYETLTCEYPALRLLLVPRHKERFDEVARLVESRGHALCRRSRGSAHSLPHPVLLLDTLGELAACWGLADVAFVGGSLTQRGGQNMLEPAGYGAAVLFGPNTWNFRDIVQELLWREAAIVVNDGAALHSTVRELLENPQARQRLGQAAQAFVLTQQGATAQTLDLLCRTLPSRPSAARPAA